MKYTRVLRAVWEVLILISMFLLCFPMLVGFIIFGRLNSWASYAAALLVAGLIIYFYDYVGYRAFLEVIAEASPDYSISREQINTAIATKIILIFIGIVLYQNQQQKGGDETVSSVHLPRHALLAFPVIFLTTAWVNHFEMLEGSPWRQINNAIAQAQISGDDLSDQYRDALERKRELLGKKQDVTPQGGVQ